MARHLKNKGGKGFQLLARAEFRINSAKSFQKIEVDLLRRKVMDESNYFSRYVKISKSTSNSELYVLIHIASFMEAMEKEPEKYEGLK